LALVALKKEQDLLGLIEAASRLSFNIVGIVMHAAPIGAFGAMAFTIGKYGIGTLFSLGKLLLCVYLTCFAFVFIVLGLICFFCGISLLRFLSYIREELLIVIGTSSSEPALPGLLLKMQRLGCSKSVAGLVIPAGYSFNLDGTSIYLVIAALFIAQATGTKLSLGQEMFVILMLMINSKGAATVTGGGFITLAATLAALGTIPVGGIALVLGVDRFMSQCRSITNLIGNGVATIVIAKWENEFDAETANRVLRGEGGLTLEHEDVVESVSSAP
jgi:aerobic C4-dicarboxylate transport protein